MFSVFHFVFPSTFLVVVFRFSLHNTNLLLIVIISKLLASVGARMLKINRLVT